MSDEVQRGKLSQFKPAERNSNKHTAKGLKALANSMNDDGYVAPMTASADGEILDGSARLETAFEKFGDDALIVKHDGKTPIVMIREDIPDANHPMARRIHYRANMVSWLDFQLNPDIVMADIEAGFDFEAIDISLPDLGEMLEGAARELLKGGNGQPEPEMPTETEAAKLARQYDVKPGQVWELGRHLIACIDSTDEAAVKELIGGQKVGMVWADPPYGISAVGDDGKTGGHGRAEGYPFGGTRNDGKNKPIRSNIYAPIAGDASPEVARKLSGLYLSMLPNSCHIWWGANNYTESLPVSTAWIVWDKQNGDNDFADCELAWTNHAGAARLFRHTWNGMIKESERGERRVHPTQKPIALAEWCFTKYGQPANLIFDPFLGSGISVLAAERLNDNRRVIGCELSPEYIAVTIHRFQQMTGQTPRLISE